MIRFCDSKKMADINGSNREEERIEGDYEENVMKAISMACTVIIITHYSLLITHY